MTGMYLRDITDICQDFSETNLNVGVYLGYSP